MQSEAFMAMCKVHIKCVGVHCANFAVVADRKVIFIIMQTCHCNSMFLSLCSWKQKVRKLLQLCFQEN